MASHHAAEQQREKKFAHWIALRIQSILSFPRRSYWVLRLHAKKDSMTSKISLHKSELKYLSRRDLVNETWWCSNLRSVIATIYQFHKINLSFLVRGVINNIIYFKIRTRLFEKKKIKNLKSKLLKIIRKTFQWFKWEF